MRKQISVLILFTLILSIYNQLNAQTVTETQKLKASDGEIYESYGYSAAIFNDFAVVGAYQDNDNGVNAGSAYILKHQLPGDWTEEIKIFPTNFEAGSQFGSAVDIYNDLTTVGAYHQNNSRGSVFIFQKDSGGINNWGELAELTASDATDQDFFGQSVAVYGNYIVVGAWGDDENGSNSGSAYVFKFEGFEWNELTKILPDDGIENQSFGWDVAISDTTIVVGASFDDDNGNFSGSAYVFTKNTGGDDNWGFYQKLTASDGLDQDFFGNSVDISGNKIVVGADGVDDNGSFSGAAYIFEYTGSNWEEVKKLLADAGAESDRFGHSVAVSNDNVVVGAVYNNGAAPNCGAAYYFNKNEGGINTWGQVNKLVASDAGEADYFGNSVDISDTICIIGAYYDDNTNGEDAGAVYFFEFEGTTPSSILESSVNDIQIYPNPADTHVLVKCGKFKVDRISVVDITGKVILYTPGIENDKTLYLNLSSCSGGLYIIKIKTVNKVYTKKLIIK